MELDRDLLREISRRLLGLHRILLDLERYAYEARHGAVSPGDLLRLLLSDAHFAWLRSLSTLIATMDELIDAEESIASAEAQKMFGEVYRLLKSGDSGAFQDKYRQALQDSPDVVMAHAGVSGVLPVPSGEERPG